MNFGGVQQQLDQSVEEFASALRVAAVDCKFGATLDTRLRDKFVSSLLPGSIRDILLQEDDNITFSDAVKKASDLERFWSRPLLVPDWLAPQSIFSSDLLEVDNSASRLNSSEPTLAFQNSDPLQFGPHSSCNESGPLHNRYEFVIHRTESILPFKSFEPFLPASHIILYDINHSTHDPQYNPHAQELKTIIERLLASNAKYIREKSGLVLSEILYLNIHWIRYAPLSGSAWTPLPKFLQNKKAIINVKNNDNRCFAYAIAAALHPISRTKHPYRPEQYEEFFEEEGLNDIQYPVNPIEMQEIEEKLHININLFGFYDDIGKARFPMYISKQNFEQTVDLIYFNEHYAWIKDFGRFISDLSKHKHIYIVASDALDAIKLKNVYNVINAYALAKIIFQHCI